MKQTHKQKVRLAKRMRTNEEIKNKVGLFDSKGWLYRKESRLKKLIKNKKKDKNITEELSTNE